MNNFIKFITSRKTNKKKVNKGVSPVHQTKKTFASHSTHEKPWNASYNIPKEDYEKFLEVYTHYVFEMNKPCGMIELHSKKTGEKYGPIIIDFDFRFKKDIVERQFTIEGTIIPVVKIFQKMIKELYNGIPPNALSAYLFLKGYKPVRIGEKVKDGFHLMFPDIITTISSQKVLWEHTIYAFRKMLEKLKDDDEFKSICNQSIENSHPLKEIYDKTVIQSAGWFMYGSSKPNQLPYKLTHIFDSNANSITIPKMTNLEMVTKFSIKYKNKNFDIKHDYKAEETKKEDGGRMRLKKTTPCPYNLSTIEKLLNCLSAHRAEEFTEWIKIGLLLHNIDQGSEMFKLWEDFSNNKYKKFKNKLSKRNGNIQQHWIGFETCDDGLNYGALRYWAQLDNYEKYNEIMREDVFSLMKNCIITDDAMNDVNIAQVVFTLYRDIFRCCGSSRSGDWYYFKKHTWHVEENAIELQQKIFSNESDGVIRHFIKYQDHLNDQLSEIEDSDSDKFKYLDSLEARVDKLINKKLKAAPSLEKIMKILKIKFNEKIDNKDDDDHNQESFWSRLNSKTNLLGFKNGIFDLDTMEFRDGKPTDYVSFSTNYNYIPYDSELEIYTEIKNFFMQIFPRPVVREYMCKYIASILKGGNEEERFHVFIGSGANGKSKLKDLIDLMLGEYSIKMDISTFTQKRGGASGPQANITATIGKRFGYLDEPEQKSKINVGLMKEWTGRDKITARGMYEKKQKEWNNLIKLVLLCNNFPIVPANDDGVWRRMTVINFQSKFVDDVTEDKYIDQPYIFTKDKGLDKKIKKWVKEGYVMSYILEKYWPLYLKDGLDEPDEIKSYTKEYRDSMDVFSKFFKTNITRTGKGTDKIAVDELYEQYCDYYTRANPGKRYIPSLNDFCDYLKREYTTNYKDQFLYRFKYTTCGSPFGESSIVNTQSF